MILSLKDLSSIKKNFGKKETLHFTMRVPTDTVVHENIIQGGVEGWGRIWFDSLSLELTAYKVHC